MQPSDFPKLMQEVKEFQSQLEQIFARAGDSPEKQLLGAAIQNIKKGTAEAEREVPGALKLIEDEARRIKSEGEGLQEEFKKKEAELQSMSAEQEKAEAARQAAEPSLDELYGSVQPIDGAVLRAEMFAGLKLQPHAEAAPSKPVKHKDIWDESSQEWTW